MRAILKCSSCGETWSVRGISEPDVGINCMPDDRDPASEKCPECGCTEWEMIDSEYEEYDDL